MLGKCLWKMHCHDRENGENPSRVSVTEVIDSFLQAIDTIPSKRDNRQDPLLEPHYKLVSIVHKLVRRKQLTVNRKRSLAVVLLLSNTLKRKGGSDILRKTPYARNTTFSTDTDTWELYILSILKSLRVADKANWHHRMIARVSLRQLNLHIHAH